MVEHATVNRRVAGSSPARGAEKERIYNSSFDYLVIMYTTNTNNLLLALSLLISRAVGVGGVVF